MYVQDVALTTRTYLGHCSRHFLINQITDHVKRVAIATQDLVQGISVINATAKQLVKHTICKEA